jgi:hypothetical protein
MGLEHIPNLVRAQQMCSKCEVVDDLIAACEQCGMRTNMFWQDPLGKFIHYLRLYRPPADKTCYFTQLVDTTHSFYYAGFWNLDGYRN